MMRSLLMPPKKDQMPWIEYDTVTAMITIAMDYSEDDLPWVNAQDIKVCLYLQDKHLADAPATLVATEMVKAPKNDTGEQLTIMPVLRPDFSQCQHRMIEPSMYLSIDVSASTVTYEDGHGPVFGVKLGDDVQLVVKPKV